MVNDIIITIDASAETFSVQQFDGQKVVRHNEPSDEVLQDLTVNHETSKTGITRSLVRLDENFIGATSGEAELASAYVVITYSSPEGKTRCKAIGRGLLDWLIATSYANLDALAAKGYGSNEVEE